MRAIGLFGKTNKQDFPIGHILHKPRIFLRFLGNMMDYGELGINIIEIQDRNRISATF